MDKPVAWLCGQRKGRFHTAKKHASDIPLFAATTGKTYEDGVIDGRKVQRNLDVSVVSALSTDWDQPSHATRMVRMDMRSRITKALVESA